MPDLNEKLKELLNTPDTTAQYSQEDIDRNRVQALLAYLSWLVLIPLFTARESPFVRFHCNQGLVLALTELVTLAVLGILGGLPLIGWIFRIAGTVIGIVCTLLALFGIIQAIQGKAKELPLIGHFHLL